MDLGLAQARLLAEEIHAAGIPGAVAELGVYQGALAAELNRLFPDRPLYLFDTFIDFPRTDVEAEKQLVLISRTPFRKTFRPWPTSTGTPCCSVRNRIRRGLLREYRDIREAPLAGSVQTRRVSPVFLRRLLQAISPPSNRVG